MIITRKRFSDILNTNGALGFQKGRKYDENMSRLGQMNTAQRELHRVGDLNREMRKLQTELNEGRKGQWRDTD